MARTKHASTGMPEAGAAINLDARAEPPPEPNEIARRAYQKWEARGRPPGDGLADWLEAESELLKEQLGNGSSAASSATKRAARRAN